ncbi:efflux RND transporter permease subunit [Wenzhouxiangella marina]|uniref:efflux RND transporter permease subunit n=1 Tax=Wenzhouxiangella marina TaxID=1579979 RepID=UPI00147071DB|nr:efflux RND transporter permease subunit [Wenzhouxiangella marina]
MTRIGLSNPVAVAVGCILLVIFGLLSLARLPVQMTPNIERPSISITTGWRAAAPEEIESEIIEPQEDQLRDVPGLQRMTATASQGRGSINLEFDVDADLNRALIEVINRLNQVSRYPADVTEPTVRVGSDQFGDTMAWFAIQTVEGNTRPIIEYQDFIDEVVRERLERIPGISSATPRGGRPFEIRITFDPYRAAAIGVDLTRIGSRLGQNADVSGGFQEVGRRQYTLRFAGQYEVSDLENLVLDWREGRPVYLRDVASVERLMQDSTSVMSQNASPSIAMNVIGEPGINVLEVMDALKAEVESLRVSHLEPAGLTISQASDDTIYIKQSVWMVATNMILGMLLAVAVLWFFFRKFRATLMVALAIPLCLCFAFLVLDGTGRTLNVISLAGLAFATGMVLDAAIVVLENIVRQREQGRAAMESADRGASQVWGALLASTATTVAIFLPVIFLQDEAGQLFADLAVVISAAIVCSLLVAIIVLPTASYRLLGDAELVDRHASWWRWSTDRVMALTDTPRRRWGWIAGLTVVPVLVGILLLPPADYLPEGNQNSVFGFIQTPSGMGPETAQAELVNVVNDRLRPFLEGEREPAIQNSFLGFFGSGAFMGIRAVNEDEVDELLEVVNNEILSGFPDTFGRANRRPIFGGRGSRNIEVNLQAGDFTELLAAGQVGFGAIQQALPGSTVRPQPGLELAEPELRLVPDDRRIAELGWTRSDVATLIRALGNGAYLGDYFDGDRRLDVILRGEDWLTPEELMAMPLSTPSGRVATLGELTRLERTAGPNQIRRVDRRRTLSLQVTPPSGMPMEVALETLATEVEPAIRQALPPDGVITYTGTAEALNETLGNLAGSFVLAVVILYLLISALFRSFKDSVLVLLTLPMATVGGILGLRTVGLISGQAMDMLTMIGFVILLGLVVNNAILLVYRARDGEREGLSRRDAVESAIRLRLRPILMSTFTSLFGMLPLLILPGAGTELYRGLAAVIVGGMALSTLFTLLLLPSLLRMNEERVPAGTGEAVPA